MNPEDSVLVGVIKTKRDLNFLLDEHWYRIPFERMKRGIYADYLAVFLSGKVFKSLSGSIPYYAKITGYELRTRRDLIPDAPDHPRADHKYFRIAVEPPQSKTPPITNPTKRVITFIHTTGDRFQAASTISDLYSNADHFVDRLIYTLGKKYHIQQLWEAERKHNPLAPGLRISRNNLVMDAAADTPNHTIYLDMTQSQDTILAAIRAEIESYDGPVTIHIPLEGI
ncbi:MAG: hypothetical protein D6711_07075 [Chloroflexi bacterium]|nr:MAG: hypothetical protein D6711_07075 [Chloroflexota bacterium]